MQDVIKFINNLNIKYQYFDHPAVFTTTESGILDIPEVANGAKNLFLRNQNKTKYFLVTITHNKRADLKSFAKLVNEKKLSFGSAEDLKAILGLTPGSVSPFGLLNDKQKRVEFWLDKDFLAEGFICCHLNINTASIKLKTDDFEKTIKNLGYTINLL